MNRFIKMTLAAVLTASLTACAPAAQKETHDSDKLQVYTSFYAMYDFARELGGDKAEVHNMCPPGSEPHDFEPTAQDMAKLTEADVFIYNGMGIESWAESVAQTLTGTDIVICEASSNKTSSPQFNDPHVWLNPEYARMEAMEILNAYLEADSENSTYYTERFNAFDDKLKKLTEDYKTALDALPKRTIVVSHDAYASLCDAFSLTQYPINGKDNEEDPAPRKIAEIEEYITSNNIRCIFSEPLGTSTVVETIAKDTKCELAELDPFEGNLDGEDYFTVMYRNLESLKKALQ